ncbi:hypothetical protein TRFO_27828 [Tritrichomonas foetus]|uniref:Myb-like DNA-binding domain containing protein n=1 Tax=Tritrichomonas foetus TaxID=1144522 RepID=A0A1J4K544_9EUKA|nr:hypothetical protein TRFO_27828 [Tritrichomonas foetus]|eukprot:OHT04621.1 hypothetical protein TRFO_27828 [Tritrichomonas foetus]
MYVTLKQIYHVETHSFRNYLLNIKFNLICEKSTENYLTNSMMDVSDPLVEVGISYICEICPKLDMQLLHAFRTIIARFLANQVSYQDTKILMYKMIGTSNPIDRLNEIKLLLNEPVQETSDDENDENSNQGSNSSNNGNTNNSNPRRKTRSWTSHEDQRLLAGVHKYGLDSWSAVSHFVGNSRTRSQCSQRWIRVLDPRISKDQWTAEEEEKLVHLVSTLGEKSWMRVATELGNRSDVQCRYHYMQMQKDGPIKDKSLNGLSSMSANNLSGNSSDEHEQQKQQVQLSINQIPFSLNYPLNEALLNQQIQYQMQIQPNMISNQLITSGQLNPLALSLNTPYNIQLQNQIALQNIVQSQIQNQINAHVANQMSNNMQGLNDPLLTINNHLSGPIPNIIPNQIPFQMQVQLPSYINNNISNSMPTLFVEQEQIFNSRMNQRKPDSVPPSLVPSSTTPPLSVTSQQNLHVQSNIPAFYNNSLHSSSSNTPVMNRDTNGNFNSNQNDNNDTTVFPKMSNSMNLNDNNAMNYFRLNHNNGDQENNRNSNTSNHVYNGNGICTFDIPNLQSNFQSNIQSNLPNIQKQKQLRKHTKSMPEIPIFNEQQILNPMISPHKSDFVQKTIVNQQNINEENDSSVSQQQTLDSNSLHQNNEMQEEVPIPLTTSLDLRKSEPIFDSNLWLLRVD